jgi:AraC-like DNA-binding protein
MEIFCTEASAKFIDSQLQYSGLSAHEVRNVMGHDFLLENPPLTKKIMFQNVIRTFETLHDVNYQQKYELNNLDRRLEINDVHSALFSNSENCIELFKKHMRVSKLNINIFNDDIQINNDSAVFNLTPITSELNFYSPQGIFYSFAQYMKYILGEHYDANCLKVGFKQQLVPNEDKFCRAVTSNIVTKAAHNYIAIPKELATMTNRYFNPIVQPYIDVQLRKEYAIRLSKDIFFDNFQLKITEAMNNSADVLSINTIAEHMNMSRSTLYRELAERDVTFSQVIEDKRKTMALDLLTNTNTSIGEISDRLGYKNLSAFNRAFKRWFNNTPMTIRKHQS